MPVLSLASLSALLLEASSCSSLARLIRFLIRTRPHPLWKEREDTRKEVLAAVVARHEGISITRVEVESVKTYSQSTFEPAFDLTGFDLVAPRLEGKVGRAVTKLVLSALVISIGFQNPYKKWLIKRIDTALFLNDRANVNGDINQSNTSPTYRATRHGDGPP